jgi:hypothetical protein
MQQRLARLFVFELLWKVDGFDALGDHARLEYVVIKSLAFRLTISSG